ncbi:MAG TPA: hypothetical protein V6D47_04925 [Oscillatoriaceae cyanobacterium]
MSINPVASTAKRPTPASGASVKTPVDATANVSGDTLALSTTPASNDKKARALFEKAKHLDAQGFYTPAGQAIGDAIDDSKSLSTLLAYQDLIDKSDDVDGYRYADTFRAFDQKANKLGAKLQAVPAKGQSQSDAHLALANAFNARGLEGAAESQYKQASDSTDSYQQVIKVANAMNHTGKRAGNQFLTDYDTEGVAKRAASLAKKEPTKKGDAASRAYLAQAETFAHDGLTRPAEVFYEKGIHAAQTVEPLYAIQKSAEENDYAGYQRIGGKECDQDATRRIWRLQHPFKWYNPTTWLGPT